MSRLKEAVRVLFCWGGVSLCLMVVETMVIGETSWLSLSSSGLLGGAITIWAFGE